MNGDNMGGPHDEGRLGVRSYMSDAEAKGFHRTFITSAAVFVLIAIVAHVLVWNWRSWAPPASGYKDAPVAAAATTSMNTVAPATTQHS